MKLLLITIIFILFNTQTSLSSNIIDSNSKVKNSIDFQDKSHLIKKTKAKINALIKKRKKLKDLKKWSETNEKGHQQKIEKLNNYLVTLGDVSQKKINPEEIIKKLQKELKFLNNRRVNNNANEKFTKKDDSIYKRKAAVLIDSIIKLRIKKR